MGLRGAWWFAVSVCAVGFVVWSSGGCANGGQASDPGLGEVETEGAAGGGQYGQPLMAAGSRGRGYEDQDESQQRGAGQGKRTWKRSKLVPNTSRVKVGEDRTLDIRGMEADIRIDGFRARVLIDFYFHNPDEQRYEGRFKVRLPNGASPYFLAFGRTTFEQKPKEGNRPPAPKYSSKEKMGSRSFEPAGIMEDRKSSWASPKRARIVPKQRAAHAYQDTVRQKVDPALMEWAGPGIFNAQLFPIEPDKLHRVVLGYDVNLTRIDDELAFEFPVPAGLPSSSVSVNVGQLDGVDIQTSPAREMLHRDGRAYAHFENPTADRIRVRLGSIGATAMTGRDEAGGRYFAARFQPEVSGTSVSPSKRAVFLVDASLSSSPDRFNIWLKLMRAILAENRDRLEEFAVLFFNVETFWWKKKFVDNTPSNVEALSAFANGLALEGATDLGAALEAAADPAWADSDGFDAFLLSDGRVTWGREGVFGLSKKFARGEATSLFAYRTGMSGEDVRMLRGLARETGGAVFSVVGESEIPQASRAHRVRPWRIKGVAYEGAEDLMFAGRPRNLYPGQRLLLVGRGGVKKNAKIRLTLQRRETTKEVSTTVDHVIRSPLSARAYGQIAVGQLEQFLGSTRQFAEAYARHFRVARKSSSFLMLESEAEYKEYGIDQKDDARLVAQQLASELVAKAVEEMSAVLGNAKAEFERWVEQLEEVPGVKMRLKPSFAEALEGVSAKYFEVDAPALSCEVRSRKKVSEELRGKLAEGDAPYEAVVRDSRRRLEQYGPSDGLKALSSLVEANPADAAIVRDVGFMAMEWGLNAHAYHLFRGVAKARPYQPQSYRAMARSLAAADRPTLALAYFELASSGNWAARFGSYDGIVRLQYLRFLRNVDEKKLAPPLGEFARQRRKELAEQVDLETADLLVTITWTTDRTDVDLHVEEPTGERCFFKNQSTKIGGTLTGDVTEGYGPEMYVLEEAPSGQYDVDVKYYASDRFQASAKTKVYATVYTRWGTKREEVRRKTVTLEQADQMQDVVTIQLSEKQ